MGPGTVLRLACAAVLLGSAPSGGRHVFQYRADCLYDPEVSEMIYQVRNIYNMRLLNMYDSRVGKYVGYDHFGIRNALRYNNQTWKMFLRRAQVETLCRYHAWLFRRSTLDRQVAPQVSVGPTRAARYGARTVLRCSARGFYPRPLSVSWLRDGARVSADVTSTDVLSNEDWSFQLHSYLELTPRRGETVTCSVEHSSLMRPLLVDWDSSPLYLRQVKLAVGVASLLIGLSAAAGGAVYSWWKRRSDFRLVDGQTLSCLSQD